MKTEILRECFINTVKPVLSGLLKRRPKIGFQYQLSLNAGQGEHSAILSTFIKLPLSIKTFVLSVFKWLLKTGFTVHEYVMSSIISFTCKHSVCECEQ